MPKKNKKKSSVPKIVAIDFETLWTTEYSIAKMSNYQYVHHPEFMALLVALYCPHMEFVGQVENFEWNRIKGYTLIAHNASFDQRVFESLQEKGLIPEDLDVNWVCSSDLCVYLQYQRNLKGATKQILGIEHSKEIRDSMKGKTWNDIVAEDTAKATMVYAMDDARYCYDIYDKLADQMPDVEKRLSVMTREIAWAGLPADVPEMESRINTLETKLWEARNRLPWYDEIDPDTKKPYAVYSKKALALHCREAGVPPPKTLDKNKEAFREWDALYGKKITFAADMQNVQRINKHLQTLRAMEARLTPEHRISYDKKYFGADATGRWSGAGGFNVQNLPRAPQYGVDIRSCIKAPSGKTLLVVDLAQIEARITAWFAGNMDFLEMLKDGTSPYEAHARQTMGWTGGKLKVEDPELYLLAKVRVLQLGYGSGWYKFAETVKAHGQQDLLDRSFTRKDEVRFQEFAGAYQPGKATLYPQLPTYDRRQWVNAFIQVDDFRKKNPGITARWKSHDSAFKAAANDVDDYSIQLPSGRTMTYFRCRHESDGVTAAVQRGSPRRMFFYGANLFQNSVQATARDIFAEHLYALDQAAFKIILHVHDEVVIEIDEEHADKALQDVINFMSKAPKWASVVPLAAEGIVTKEYTK